MIVLSRPQQLRHNKRTLHMPVEDNKTSAVEDNKTNAVLAGEKALSQ